jgi:hypothetical protein
LKRREEGWRERDTASSPGGLLLRLDLGVVVKIELERFSGLMDI